MILVLKRIYFLLLTFLTCGALSAHYKVFTTPVVPMAKPLSGHFSGELNEQLWTWGGYRYDEAVNDKFADRQFIGYAFGATVDVPQGSVCIGGTSDGIKSLPEVFLSRKVTYREGSFSQWQFDRGSRKTLPRLPKPLHNNVAAFWDGYLYTLGGQTDSVPNLDVFRLEWPNGTSWEHFGTIPGGARIQAVAAVQNNSNGPALYVFGGYSPSTSLDSAFIHRNAICMNLNTYMWDVVEFKNQDNGLLPTVGAQALSLGGASIAVIGGLKEHVLPFGFENHSKMFSANALNEADNRVFQENVLIYNTYTNSWNSLPGNENLARIHAGFAKIKGFWFLSGGETQPGVCSEQVTCVEIVDENQLSIFDYVSIFIFAALFLCIVLVCCSKKKTLSSNAVDSVKDSAFLNGISLYMSTFGPISFWIIPLSAFAYGYNLFLPYCISVTLFVLLSLYVSRKKHIILNEKSSSSSASASFPANGLCRFVFIIQLFVRTLFWIVLPVYLITQATSLSWLYALAVSLVVPAIAYIIAGRTVSRYSDVFCFVSIISISVLCIIFLGFESPALPNVEPRLLDFKSMPLSLVILFLLPLLAFDSSVFKRNFSLPAITKEQYGRSLLVCYSLSIGGFLLFSMLGAFLHMYYQSNPQLFPLYMDDISLLIPSHFLSAMPSGIVGLSLAALLCTVWCAIIRYSYAFFLVFDQRGLENHAGFSQKTSRQRIFSAVFISLIILLTIAFFSFKVNLFALLL